MDNNQNEHILTAIPARMKTGLLSNESYHLVLTNKRFIFAHHQRNLVISPEKILEGNNDNFYCDHGLIHWIELIDCPSDRKDKYQGEQTNDIIITTTDVSYRLVVENQEDIKVLRSHLKNMIPQKIKKC